MKASQSSTRYQLQRKISHVLMNKDVEALYELIEGGLHPDYKATGKKRMVYHAAAHREPLIFDALVALGADLNLPPVGSSNPLYGRFVASDVRGVKRLLAAGADAMPLRDCGSKQRDTMVHKLSRVGATPRSESDRPLLLKLLLDAGGWVHLHQPSSVGRLPVEEAENAMLARRNASSHEMREALEETIALLETYAALPRVRALGESYGKAELLAPALDSEHSVLEHPDTWKRWDEVLAKLDARGEWLSKDDLLLPRDGTVDGKPWMERAIECYALPQVLKGLNAEGASIGRDDLLDAAHQPTKLFKQLEDYRQLTQLFTADNTQGWSRSEFNDILNAMQPHDRALCTTNLHQLQVNAERNRRASTALNTELEIS